jgi:hypothetical protein
MAWLRREKLALDRGDGIASPPRKRGQGVHVTLAAALVAGAVVIGAGSAATQTKNFSASLAQASQTTYTLTLSNNAESTQPFASANVTVPSGFTGVSVPATASAPAGKTWTSKLSGNIIELRAADKMSPLAPTQSLTLTITATAGCGSYVAPTRVKQSNNFLGTGNDFVGSSPTVSVIGPAASFVFGTIASPQVVGASFSAGATAKDACNNTASFYSGTASLSGLEFDGNTPPTPATMSFASGSGTAAVTAVRAQEGATLTATDGAATGTSNAFDVVTRLCKSSDTSCSATHADGTKVTAPVPPTGTTVLSLSGPGNSFTCEGSTYDSIGSSVIVDPTGGGYTTQTIEITLQWSLAEAGPGSRVLCMSKEGGPFFEVDRCGRTPVAPCERDRSKSGDILTSILVIDPTDPEFDLG